ncbi:ubiquitin-conjugating enzyme/RWD-like protein [Pyronema omphalodes]|nr:ubiquitin-conjugating enzyme/RWD-like protein [Pyronema omphalodes]
MSNPGAARLLQNQLKDLKESTHLSFISAGLHNDNIFEWELVMMLPDDIELYGGGMFNATLSFPRDYPYKPPKMKFTPALWHPNIYDDGNVCISILHAPGEDQYGYESADERWSPVQTVETILLSVISMLSSPNDESPANVDAARQWREDPQAFKRKVRQQVGRSLE